jgi:glutamate---cysteine ligase / carboxylate-amine ligase
MSVSTYRIGIEEEFFVFDARTRRAVRRLDAKLLKRAQAELGDMLKHEMLQSQIEVATPPCETLSQARGHLVRCRRVLGEAAAERKLGIAALGTFPLAFWTEQQVTPKARYDAIMADLQMIGLRNMLCGMHMHVEVADPSGRIDLIRRAVPFLPVLLALSVSSPFWQSHLTGLAGYRLAAYDELPRTGLPELFRTNEEYDAYVAALVGAGIIPDASYIWWAIRPSLRFPTVELRIADSCTRVDDTIAIAALFRCLLRALEQNRSLNAEFDRVGRAITNENKWHAQRHGMAAVFVHPLRRARITAAEWLHELRALAADHAAALRCRDESAHLDRIVSEGTGAERQIAVYNEAKASGCRGLTALKAVVDWAARETLTV